MKKKTITNDHIQHNQSFSGDTWETYCPECLTKLEISSWLAPKCKCGYVWRIKTIAVGERKEKDNG